MRVTICAVGRLRKGPESELVSDYLTRFDRAGRRLGLGPARVSEVEARGGGGPQVEAQALRRAIPENSTLCALDERGDVLSSPKFARRLGDLRDDGTRDVAFLIGGADGIDPGLLAQANLSISFGKMVWPHMLARVMLCEQLYRAASILAGAPYHRA